MLAELKSKFANMKALLPYSPNGAQRLSEMDQTQGVDENKEVIKHNKNPDGTLKQRYSGRNRSNNSST